MGHIAAKSRIERAFKAGTMLACVAVLGGCGGGVELEGKIFDYMGVSGSGQEADVRMSERPPLMVPPNLQTLPPPGTNASVATARPDWPDDPERVRKRAKAEADAKAAEVEAENDPINPYAGKPTLLDKLFARSKTEEEPVADVPEPDPSDRPASEGGAVAQARPQPLTPHVPEAPVPDQSAFHPDAPDSYNDVSSGTNSGF